MVTDMRITVTQLRRIIKEELLRESRSEDLQAAKDMSDIWADLMKEALSFSGPPPLEDYMLERISRIPSPRELLNKIDGDQFKSSVDFMKPQLMPRMEELYFEKLRKGGVDSSLITKEIKPLYAEWINIMTQYAVYMITAKAQKGAFAVKGSWSGLENLGPRLVQVFNRSGGRVNQEDVQMGFVAAVEPLTELLQKTLYSVS